MKRIRFIALELDGTLLNGRKQLPSENRDSLQEVERGMLVSIASGRITSSIEAIEAQLGPEAGEKLIYWATQELYVVSSISAEQSFFKAIDDGSFVPHPAV